MPRTRMGRPRIPRTDLKDLPEKFYADKRASDALTVLARRHKLSKSSLIRMVLAKYIDDELGSDDDNLAA